MNRTFLCGVLLSSLSLVACVEAPELGDAEQGAGIGSGDRGNGRHHLGELADFLPGMPPGRGYSTDLVAVTGETFDVIANPAAPGDGTCLKATIGGQVRTCAAAAFIGKVLPGAGNKWLRIDDARAYTTAYAGHTVAGYRLSYGSSATGPWTSYCANGRLAHPLKGELNTNGAINLSRARLTFACTEYRVDAATNAVVFDNPIGSGTLGKVAGWGYEAGTGYTFGANHTSISGAELQALASRVAQADYCYSGGKGTLDGSVLGLGDYVDGNVVPNPTGPIPTPFVPGMVVSSSEVWVEAVWARPNHSELTDGSANDVGVPVCLSKLRWSTFPIGDRCGTRLRDPRINHADGINGSFCDDFPYDQFYSSGAGLIVSSSKFNDLSLNAWTNSNGDSYTTTIGVVGRGPAWHIAPQAGYSPTPSNTAAMLGTIMTVAGAQVIQNNPAYPAAALPTVTLVSCAKLANPGAGEKITTTSAAIPNGYGNCQTEGLIWSAAPPAALLADLGVTTAPKLFRYYRSTTPRDYLTTTASTAPNGYAGGLLLGYILPPRS
ncbi:MAG: hypothetical protein IPH44_35645 [Myxococcales bacterium]|nr:hypothetical protein [Myxococcales bacterium]MBK7194775.1 hypothetical protein [Myxococcales bacterium]MBP6842433.1 hypothetical protein [Kofleriaceae bacterium]